MFCNKPKHSRNLPAKKNRKRKKKSTHPQVDSNKKTKHRDHSISSLATAMSTWAENYTVATTWQLKHQVAYWKARAKALEYENNVLHDTIRNSYFKDEAHKRNVKPTTSNAETIESSESDDETEQEVEYEDEEEEGDGDEFEVSEEFIEFLKKNAEFKEDVRREKARLAAEVEAKNNEILMEKLNSESSEEKQIRLTKLYGDNWEKIMALETFTLCNFLNESDKERPDYWPNIPFNFDSYNAS